MVFDLVVEGPGIRLQPRRKSARRVRKAGGWPVLAAAPGQVLTDADVPGLSEVERR